ncbi:Inositolphosphorylceramide synthase subunit Kei1-domain-containing protein [Mycena alexandri]|uniref:Inositolphosphorylceramide synthase subunit Kei1-domain-containing protein n=1 Tax=Mycena alexandri TaxID=1745969 RepID=A0AAD6S333_9AGAR|nr:Inositolphosphorylceramide synthase subunit Kei1-domain-containing protein [Mycena alexandri]
MKLTLRSGIWPLNSFLGLLDLKTGVTIALLFAVFNKIAGFYGLIAVLTGAGGSFAQLSLYIYSVLGLAALWWGLQVVKAEDPRKTLYFAHLFSADYVLSTSWTAYFAVVWWFHTPHDGARQANSQAQEDLIAIAHLTGPVLTDEQRAEAARLIWNAEKGMAFAVIVISWLSKIYLGALIYSYALHLRKGSYRALALTRTQPSPISTKGFGNSRGPMQTPLPEDDEDDDVDAFYRVPLRAHGAPATPTKHTATDNDYQKRTRPAPPQPNSTAAAPPLHSLAKNAGVGGDPKEAYAADEYEADEVLFDDEYPYASSGSTSKTHSKRGTDTSRSVSTDEADADERAAFVGGKV